MSMVDQKQSPVVSHSAAAIQNETTDVRMTLAQRSRKDNQERIFCTIVVVEIAPLSFTADGEDPARSNSAVLNRIHSALSASRGELIGSNENCFCVSFAIPRQAAAFCEQLTSDLTLQGLAIRCGADCGWMDRLNAVDASSPLESAANAVQYANCGDVLFSSRTVGFLGDAPGNWEEVTSTFMKRVAQSEDGGTEGDAKKNLATRARARFGRALSAKEREVAVLIAKGASNRGIANAMAISVSTVERHVSNVFLKLNLTSRLEITLLAAQGRLV